MDPSPSKKEGVIARQQSVLATEAGLKVFLGQLGREFAWAVGNVFLAGVLFYLYQEPGTPRWVLIPVTAGAILLFGNMVYQKTSRVFLRQTATDAALRAEFLNEREQAKHKDLQVSLQRGMIEFATIMLRDLTRELRAFDAQNVSVELRAKRLGALKRRLLDELFHQLRVVFDKDTRGLDTTSWPHDYFKLALFEPMPTPESPEFLQRTYYAYPEGLEPSQATEKVEIATHARAAHVIAFTNQSIEVLQDIKAESDKPASAARWVELRPNHSQDYESMVCAAIVSGRRGEPERKCIAVLVIDTNRKGYFLENVQFQAFLGNLLNLPRTILTLLLELDLYVGVREGRQSPKRTSKELRHP